MNDRKTKLLLRCDSFVGGPHLANIEHGQGTFSACKVRVTHGRVPCTFKVNISLVSVENNRRKLTVSEILKDLKQFTIRVLPSTLPHKVRICERNRNGLVAVNGEETNGRDGRDCLELTAPAGSIVTGLFLNVFDESGKLMNADEFKAAEPKVTTSWSGEVRSSCSMHDQVGVRGGGEEGGVTCNAIYEYSQSLCTKLTGDEWRNFWLRQT